MGRLLLVIVLIGGFMLLLRNCGPSSSQDVPFTGTWKIENENGISGSKEVLNVIVTADKKLFKTVSKGEYGETTAIYDGEMLHTKQTYVPPPGSEQFSTPADHPANPQPPESPQTRGSDVSSQKVSDSRMMPLRFWARTYVGNAGPGGKVAGQETVLYQAREKRPEGEITVQGWVDAKTGLVLKSVDTIYSSQVNSMVSKVTRECQQIQYGPVEKSAFSKPQ